MNLIKHYSWLAGMLLAGCAATPEVQVSLPPLVFPPPPEPPRFEFERSVVSSGDLEVEDQKTRWRRILTGELATGKVLGKPFDITVCQGHIYVSDTVRRSVMAFDIPAREFFEIGKKEGSELLKPLGVQTDEDCDLYVADATSRRIMVYDQAGQFIKALGGPEWFKRLSHVAVNSDGTRVFAVDTGGINTQDHRIRVFDGQSGEHLYDIGSRGEGPGQFNLPRDVELGHDGMLYVVDGANFRVQILKQDGTFVRSIGELGRRYGQFSRPKGIATDSEGNIYVSDASFGNFQIFNPKGELLLFVGSRSEQFDRATYMLPAGLDVDEDGRVYMVDQYFRKFDIYRPVNLGVSEGFLGAWANP